MSFVATGVSVGLGAYQAISGGIKAHKAQKAIDNLQSPTYTPNQAIGDYYSKALSRYSANPYQSSLYKMQNQNIQRSTAQGISALNDRRLGIGGISSLIQGQNDSLLKAGAAAEGEQGQRLGQLGQAAGMKAQDDKYAFQTNQLMPYQQKMNILTGKAIGGNQEMNAGISNAFGGLAGYGQAQNEKAIYGTYNQRNPRSSGLGNNGSGISNSVGAGGPIVY
jgi:hypothetical protein